ncbi:MAG: GTP-binding protein [Planctomycetota bacterium]
MVQINFHSREVNCKIVFYGPGRSGKTTNLEVVHRKAPKDSVGELVSIATEQDRTLYFDFLPLNLGMVAGMTTKFQLYTVPGQVYYNETRKLVLQGTDGVVFVADSHPDMENENVSSLNNLVENLKENGIDIADLPLVIQYNKRDLPNAMAVEKLNASLNRWNAPFVPAVAISDEKAVFKTLKLVSSLVIKKLNRQNGTADPAADEATESSAATPAVSAPPPAPAAPVPPPPVMAPPPAAASTAVPRPSMAPPPAPPRPPAPGIPSMPGSSVVPRPVMSIPQAPRPSGPMQAVTRQSGPIAVPPRPPALSPSAGVPSAPPPPPPPRPVAPPPPPMPAAAVSAPPSPPPIMPSSPAPAPHLAQAMAQATPAPLSPASGRASTPANAERMREVIAAGSKGKSNAVWWVVITVILVVVFILLFLVLMR